MNTKILTIFILYILCLLVYYYCLKKKYFEYFTTNKPELNITTLPNKITSDSLIPSVVNYDENIHIKANQIQVNNLDVNTFKGEQIHLGNHILNEETLSYLKKIPLTNTELCLGEPNDKYCIDYNKNKILHNFFPYGTIIPYYGNKYKIPEGWLICNGKDPTPDLSDRFIVGSGNKYSSGSTGGESVIIVEDRNLPKEQFFTQNVIINKPEYKEMIYIMRVLPSMEELNENQSKKCKYEAWDYEGTNEDKLTIQINCLFKTPIV